MNFIQQVVNGLSLGAIYALIAIGFSLVYGVLGLVNFAHGDIYMGGTFIAYWLYVETGFPLVVALVLAIAGGAAASVAVERVASRPVGTFSLPITGDLTFNERNEPTVGQGYRQSELLVVRDGAIVTPEG